MAHLFPYKKLIFFPAFLLGLFLSGIVQGQEPVLSLRAPESVPAGQAFEITYSINVRGSKSFQAPAFKGLDLLFGPMQSQSSSFQFVNGKQSQSFSLTYTYQLRAPQAGSFQFGRASIVVDGKTYHSEPFHLTVTAAQASSSQTSPSTRTTPQPARNPSSSTRPMEVDDEDLFITASVNKRKPYVGEQVLLTYRIYTAVPVEQFSIYKTPSNKGFWTEELKVDHNAQNQEIIEGKQFIYADMRKIALFAQEAGPHTLEPMEVEALAQVPSRQRRSSHSIFDIFDDAFFSPMETVRKNLRTHPIRIDAKPLPQEGRPTSFDGLVGDYEIDFNYNKEQAVRTNEALTFTFTVSGRGNIEMIHAPQIQFPPDFEVYEPKISHNKQVSGSGISGKAVFEYIIVPRNPGVYKINTFSYSFFNPQTEKYEEKQIPEIVLNVDKGNDSPQTVASAPGTPLSGSNDIEYIRLKADKWKPSGQTLLFAPVFWGLLLGELLLFAAFMFFYRHRIKANADIAGTKNKKAAKEAKKCLKKASALMSEKTREAFYIEISQALWGFLSNKLNIPPANLSMDTVRDELEKKSIETNLIEQFIHTLEHCEFERFSPQPTGIQGMETIYREAWDIIYKIIGTLK